MDAEPTTDFVRELRELECAVKRISEDVSTARDEVFTVKSILEQYQEQPQLLDPHLEALITPFMTILSRTADELGDDAHFAAVMQMCRHLQLLIGTRGYKTILRFFPNKAPDIERALSMLRKLDTVATGGEIDEDAQDGAWQTRAVLLLWLSGLVIIPFDFGTIQVSSAESTADNASPVPPAAQWLISRAQHYLSDPGFSRDTAALMLSKLLTRDDMGHSLTSFLDWCWAQLELAGEQQTTSRMVSWQFLLPGVLFALACVFKTGARPLLLRITPTVWARVQALRGSRVLEGNMLARKLAVKLLQRCALTLLDPTSVNALVAAVAAEKKRSHINVAARDDEVLALTAEGEGILLDVIDCLVGALRDRDTVVRWSAAKGLARIAVRLPAACVEDINDVVLELFSPHESDSAWQGACFATAELVRHGLMPAHRLPQVVPLISKALHYEVRRGPHSVGGHVRDAASYVCWAFARTYKAEAMEHALPVLTPALLAASCYDREVSCRRAASAAFQESVGRLGAQHFPSGIDILTTADYFAVGSRTQSFLAIGPTIAALPQYTVPLAEHLLQNKLANWDVSVRVLAADALAALVPLQPELFANQALEQLLPQCCSRARSLEERHGALLAIGTVVAALKRARFSLGAAAAERVVAALLEVQRQQLYRGKGGELMRVAMCALVTAIVFAELPLSAEQVAAIHAMIDDNLVHPEPHIQEAGGACLKPFLTRHCRPHNHSDTARYCAGLFDKAESVRRGSAIALGALPTKLLRAALHPLHLTLEALGRACDVGCVTDASDAEARVKAIAAMTAIVEELFGAGSFLIRGEAVDVGEVHSVCCGRVTPALFTALQDYTVDNRGDVGSWVREASMAAFVAICRVILKHGVLPDDKASDLLTRIAGAMLQQALERISRLRECAASCLLQLLQAQDELQPGAAPVAAKRLRRQLERDDAPACFGNLTRLPALVSFMTSCEYRRPIMAALVASIGGIDSSLSRRCADALVCLVRSPSHMTFENDDGGDDATSTSGRLDASDVAQELVRVWEGTALSSRMATPLLKMLDMLWTRGVIGGERSEKSADGVGGAAPCSGTHARLLELIKGEGRQCSDVHRLFAVATALCHVASGAGATEVKAALQALMVLLASKFPKVRRFAAERLYFCGLLVEARLQQGAAVAFWSLEGVQVMLAILTATAWDSNDLSVATSARGRIITLLALDPPKVKSGGTKRVAARGVDAYESATYQALVDDFARGLS